MDVEKARVTGRAERLNAQAASFFTRRTNDVADRLFHGALVSRARMKTSEDDSSKRRPYNHQRPAIVLQHPNYFTNLHQATVSNAQSPAAIRCRRTTRR